MALDAMIFDVDGTLIDTNALHVEAFRRAFDAHGYRVLPDRIAVEIGKGGDTLVPSVLGREADRKDGKRIRGDQPARFAELAAEHGLRVFPNAPELLAAARRRGLRVVIATSSGRQAIETIERHAGWAFTRDADAVVNADDAPSSKPAPDLVAAAVARTGLSPAQCAMVGDTPYDATSAAAAGVVTLGVTCGGNPPEVLRTGGVRRVYNDPADLLAQLDEAVAVASPTAAHLTRSTLEFLMGEALAAAAEGLAEGGLPIGAVVADTNGAVVTRGWNRAHRGGDKTLHAEMVALSAAAGRAGPWVLVTTLEPCAMCTGATMQLGVDTVVYGTADPVNGGVKRVTPSASAPGRSPRFVGGVRPGESIALFRQWMGTHGGNESPRAAFVRQLLAAQA